MESNLMVLKTAAASLQSMLGPNTGAKCYVTGPPGESAIISDPMQVVEAVTAQMDHPLASLIHSSCLTQQETHGQACATVVTLAAQWAEEMVALVQQAIPPPLIASLFEEALAVCDSVFKRSSVSSSSLMHHLASQSRAEGSDYSHKALAFSRHFRQTISTPQTHLLLLDFLANKLTHHLPFVMKLAKEAITLQNQHKPAESSPSANKRLVVCEQVMGMAEETSKVLDGVAMQIDPEMVPLLRTADHRNCTLVVMGDASPGHAPLGLQRDVQAVTYSSGQLWQQRRAGQWVGQWATALEEHSVECLVVGGTVDGSLQDLCLSRKILLVSRVGPQQCELLRFMTGAVSIVCTAHSSECFITGTRVKVQEVHGGGLRERRGKGKGRGKLTHHCYMKPAEAIFPAVTTVLVCGMTRNGAEALCYRIKSCLSCLQEAVTGGGGVVLGGGAIEAACVREIEERACGPCSQPAPPTLGHSWMTSAVSETRARVYRAFAVGLRNQTAHLLSNHTPGMSPADVQTAVEELVSGGGWVGLRAGLRSATAVDLTDSKLEGWTRAYELSRAVLFLNMSHNAL